LNDHVFVNRFIL